MLRISFINRKKINVMKAKIISTIAAFALMIVISSCNVLIDKAKFSYLNKVPATSDISDINSLIPADSTIKKDIKTDGDSAPESMMRIAVGQIDPGYTNDFAIGKTTNGFSVNKTIRSGIKIIRPVAGKALSIKRSTCSVAPSPQSSENPIIILALLILFFSIIATCFLTGGWILGLLGIVLLGPVFFIAIMVLAFSSGKKKHSKKTGNESVDTESAFVYESSPTGTSEKTGSETKTREKQGIKKTPWGLIAICGGILILALFFGPGIILLALVFALVAAVIASGIWMYNFIISNTSKNQNI